MLLIIEVYTIYDTITLKVLQVQISLTLGYRSVSNSQVAPTLPPINPVLEVLGDNIDRCITVESPAYTFSRFHLQMAQFKIGYSVNSVNMADTENFNWLFGPLKQGYM